MVTCIDKHTAEIAALTSRQVPIFESGLEELLAASVAGRLFGIPARGCCDRRFQAPRSDRDQHDGHARPRGHGRNRPLYLNQPPMFLVDDARSSSSNMRPTRFRRPTSHSSTRSLSSTRTWKPTCGLSFVRGNPAKHWFQISGVNVVPILVVRAGRPGPSLESQT